jgi:GT2 family glycosyltransferase
MHAGRQPLAHHVVAVAAGPPVLDVGAVIVTHDRCDLAIRCASAVAEEIPASSIVVVVNDPSSCSRIDLDRLEAAIGTVVTNAAPRGYGANLNEGTRRLEGRCGHYVLLNDDTIPAPGAIACLVRAFEDDPTAAVAGPRIVDLDGNARESGFRFPTVLSELVSAVILPTRCQVALRRRLAPDPSATRVDWVLGAAFLVQAEAFREVRGFDESYFLYSEETDLAYRLKLRGWSSLLCRDAVVRHVGGASTPRDTYARLLGLSRARFIRKHWSLSRRLVLACLLGLTYAWNTAYVACRVALSPRSFQAKRRLWLDHWLARPVGSRRSRQPEGAA